jgi:hypothetical protein
MEGAEQLGGRMTKVFTVGSKPKSSLPPGEDRTTT